MPAAVIEHRAEFYWSSWNRRYQSNGYVFGLGLLEVCEYGPTTYFVIAPKKRFDLVVSTNPRGGYRLERHRHFGIVVAAHGKKVNFYRSTEIWLASIMDRHPRRAFYLSLEIAK